MDSRPWWAISFWWARRRWPISSAPYFSRILDERFAHLQGLYRSLYPAGSYAPAGDYNRRLGRRVRELCLQHGLADRIPRPIIPGDRRAHTKRVVERLANQAYALELEAAPAQRVWTYRKAAWAIEALEQDIGLVYQQMGRKGLQAIPGVGPAMADAIQAWIKAGTSEGEDRVGVDPGQVLR